MIVAMSVNTPMKFSTKCLTRIHLPSVDYTTLVLSQEPVPTQLHLRETVRICE